jgi:hypothetical protein
MIISRPCLLSNVRSGSCVDVAPPKKRGYVTQSRQMEAKALRKLEPLSRPLR